MADFTVKGDTKLDSSGFSTGLGKLGKLASKGLAVIGTASVAAIGAVAAAGVQYNASMEQYQTAFATMLGGSEAADTLTNSLKTLAAKTPLAMSDLADASKTLLAFGSSADELPDTLRKLGDVAMGDAQKLGTMATAFGRIQSNGRASMEEINMMIDQGFNPLNIIAEQTGETMEEVRKRVSDGGVSFEELSGALDVATSAGGQFYGAMEAQSKTLNGQLSTLSDNASALAGAMAEGLSEGIASTLLPTINGWVDQLLVAVQEQGIEGAISVAGQIIAEAVNMLLEAAPQLIETAVSLVTAFLSGIQAMLPSLGQGATGIITSLATGIYGLLPQIITVGAQLVVTLAQAIINALPTVCTAGMQALSTLVDTIVNNLPQIIDTGTKLILSLIDGLVKTIPDLVAQIPALIVKLVVAIAQNLPKIISAGAQIITSLISGIGQMAGNLIAKFPELMSQIWDAVKNIDWIDLGKSIIKGLINGIGSMGSALWDAAKNIAKKALDSIKKFFGIKSPSRVMRDQVGKMLPAGMAIGVEADTDKAVHAAEMAADEMVQAAQQAVGQAQYQVGAGVYTAAVAQQEPVTGTQNVSNVQYVTFEQPMQAPDEIARALRIQQTYGLAGAR